MPRPARFHVVSRGPGRFQRFDVALLALPVLLAMNGLATQVLGPWDEGVTIAFGALKDVILAALVLRLMLDDRWRVLPSPVLVACLSFVVIGLASVWAASSVRGAAYGWRNDYLPALMLLPAAFAFRAAHVRRAFVHVVAVVANIGSAVMISTWATGIDWMLALGILPPAEGESFPTSYFSSGSTLPRGFSPWVAPNEAGAALVIMLALIWTVRPGLSLRWRFLCSLLPLVAIFATHSRSTWLGVVSVVTLMSVHLVLRRWGWRGALVASLACVGGVVAAAVGYLRARGGVEADPSLGGHYASLERTLTTIASNPFGVGLGDVGPRSFRYADETVLVESFFLLIATEAGVLALVALLGLLGSVLWVCARRSVHSAYVAAAVVAAAGVSQSVLPTMQEGAVSYLYWSALGLALGTALSENGGVGLSADATAHGSERRLSWDGLARLVRRRPTR